jgi:hypothetical protein
MSAIVPVSLLFASTLQRLRAQYRLAARSVVFAFETPRLSVDFNACSASVRCGDGTSAGLFLLVPEQGWC